MSLLTNLRFTDKGKHAGMNSKQNLRDHILPGNFVIYVILFTL